MAKSSVFQTSGADPSTLQTFADDLSAFASQAEASADAAATSASQAASSLVTIGTSVTDAQTAKTGAQTAETGAQTAQTASETAKTAAETAETNAETAETNAASSATTASTQATNAASSATTASGHASTATTKASEASTSATNAATSAATATTQASTATTKASEASTSATNAATSASTASTQASNASTSASTASTQASNAAASASTASGHASTATTKASEAATSATNAATSASTASTQATNAGNSATAAASSASAASTSASNAASSLNSFNAVYSTGSSDPTSNLDTGDLFYNSSSGVLKVYTGSAWEQGVTAGSGFLALTGGQLTGNITFSGSQTVDGRDVSADGTKLDGIEASATADQTDAEIRAAVEAASDSNVFTDADHTKLNAIEALADVTDATNVAAAGALMTTGGSVTGDVSFGDSNKATFGNAVGGDLSLHHDGSNSYIIDNGTGDLVINTNGNAISLNTNGGGEYGLRVINNGAVNLYYDNALKLATTATGVDVTGALSINSFGDPSNNYITLRPSFAPSASGGIGFAAKDHDGANNDGLGVFGHDGVSFTTGGSERMRITSGGSVGIGTASPHANRALHVSSTAQNHARFERTGSATSQIEFQDSTTTNQPSLGGDGDDLTFRTSFTERMRLDSSGNVGIGNNSPSGLLHLTKGTRDLQFLLETTPASGDQGVQLRVGSGDYLGIASNTGTGIIVDSSNNVGIGTSVTGDAELVVYGADAATIYKNVNTGTGSGDGFFVGLAKGNGTDAYVYHRLNAPLIFGTSNAERMRLDSSGNMGIGLSSGIDGKLHVAGNTVVGDSSTTAFSSFTSGGLDVAVGSGTAAFQVWDDNSTSTPRFIVERGGNVLVGRTTSSNFGTLSLDYTGASKRGIVLKTTNSNSAGAIAFANTSDALVGSITVTASSTAYNTSSDYRLKTDVAYDWDATSRLKQLKPARFAWIADGDDAVPVDGFLAHEVQDVVPEAISGTKDEVDANGNPVMQGIDQSKIVPLLVKTVIELEARIAALEAN